MEARILNEVAGRAVRVGAVSAALACALAFGIVSLPRVAEAQTRPGPSEGGGVGAGIAADDGDGYRLYQDLTVVRENLALLGTPLCIFVGFFPEGESDDWAKEAIRAPKVSVHWGEVTFVRHRRRAVRDFDERFLRERGVPAHQAWEGVVVVDKFGEAVRALPRPISLTRLGIALREAVGRGVGTGAGAFEKKAPPGFRYAITKAVFVCNLDPKDSDLELGMRGAALTANLVARRFGPFDQRGELASAEEIGALRHEARAVGEAFEEESLRHQGFETALWSYRAKRPEPGARFRAEALVAVKGDVYTLTVESDAIRGKALRRKARALLEGLTITLGPTDSPNEGDEK